MEEEAEVQARQAVAIAQARSQFKPEAQGGLEEEQKEASTRKAKKSTNGHVVSADRSNKNNATNNNNVCTASEGVVESVNSNNCIEISMPQEAGEAAKRDERLKETVIEISLRKENSKEVSNTREDSKRKEQVFHYSYDSPLHVNKGKEACKMTPHNAVLLNKDTSNDTNFTSLAPRPLPPVTSENENNSTTDYLHSPSPLQDGKVGKRSKRSKQEHNKKKKSLDKINKVNPNPLVHATTSNNTNNNNNNSSPSNNYFFNNNNSNDYNNPLVHTFSSTSRPSSSKKAKIYHL